MNFTVKTTSPAKAETDLLVLFSEEDKLGEAVKDFNQDFIDLVHAAAKKEKFTGEEGESLILYTKGNISSYKTLIAGLGKEESDLYKLRKATAEAIKKANGMKVGRVGFMAPQPWFKKYSVTVVGQAIVEGAALGGYKFLKYKSEEEKQRSGLVEEVYIISTPNKVAGLEEGIRIGKIMAENTIYARDLINEPSAVTTPSFLAMEAEKIAKGTKGKVNIKIYEKEEAEKMGMGAFLGVAKGSDEPPKFIMLSYKGAHPKGKVAIIGKGITFDTGGLSLKPAEHMETMKMDMAGAAVVLAVFRAVTELKPDIELLGIIASCENMPSGKALKPGDILRAYNGKTIEVLNTDAEGRLTLADALSFAVTKKPDAIIDLATLTGACMVALGQEIAGLWSNDTKLTAKIEKAAELAGERVWSMPLPPDYKELIKSHIADIKNTQTGRYGGAITAALFLAEFVGRTPWVHLDIAGPAYEEKETALVPLGGAGYGVRCVLQFLLDY